jgi:Flp pilus assembly protein TadG
MKKLVMDSSASKRESGLAMIEFAVVLPLMLLLILGVAELGRAFMQYNVLTKSVRDGVRHLAQYAPSGSSGTIDIDAQTMSETKNLVVYGNSAGAGNPLLDGFSPGQVTVVDAGGENVRVDASYPYQPVFGPTLPTFGFGPAIPVTFTMQASVTMKAIP